MYAQYCRLGLPVWASNRAVIREARKMLAPASLAPAYRRNRHKWLRAMLSEHEKARRLYEKVRRGF